VRLLKYVPEQGKTKSNMFMFLNISVKRWSLIFLILLACSTFSIAQDAPAVKLPAGLENAKSDLGEQLFKENCTQCHSVSEVVVGPALGGITKERSVPWLIKWVHNSQKLIQSGDKDAKAVYEKFDHTDMPAFPQFTPDDIKNILAYVETTHATLANAPKVATNSSGDENGATATSKGNSNSTLILTLIIIVLVLVLLMLVIFLSVIKKYLADKESKLNEAEKDLLHQKFEISKVLKSKGFITIVILIFVCIGVRSCWVGLLSIGVEQNYAPKQPIPFSHKQHVGQYKIECVYCHTGAKRGKQANIPSVNICMNCHSSIKSGSRFGTAAIALVRTAWEKKEPIKWVRVHNLPDLAYFNHSQHTVVGGIECERCHGPIGTMEVIKQYSPLTMGWCINCHRETLVNGKGNAYYDKLYALHNGETLTVQEMGGLECSKCHY